MLTTTLYLTPAQKDAIDLLHARTRVPRAVFYREAIDLVLAKHAEQITLDFEHDATE